MSSRMSEATEFKVEKRGNEYCAVSEDGSRSFGCYPTEDEARERLRQVEAAKAANNADELAALEVITIDVFADKDAARVLKDVEIFRVGTWNGRKFTSADLDDIITSFDKVGYRVPVKLGHSDEVGGRAFGWVENLRRSGDRLVADLVDLNKKVFDTIKDRGYDAVSSEIYLNLKRGGQMFRRALKAVALLGAETPAVADLKPLRESFSDLSAERVVCLTFEHKEDNSMDEKQIAELEKAKADAEKLAQDAAKERDDLKAAVDAANAEIAKLKQKSGDETEAALAVKRLEAQIEALEQRNAANEESNRKKRIELLVSDFPYPRLRSHFSALLDLATKAKVEDDDGKIVSATVKFTFDDKEVDADPEKVVSDLMAQLAKESEKLFTQLSDSGILRRDDAPPANRADAGVKLDQLAKSYQAKNGEKDYGKAFEAVLNDPDNRELVARYAAAEK